MITQRTVLLLFLAMAICTCTDARDLAKSRTEATCTVLGFVAMEVVVPMPEALMKSVRLMRQG